LLTLGILSFASFFGSAQATYYGMYPIVALTSHEITASSWFYEHAPREAQLVVVLGSFPQRLDRHYVERTAEDVNEPTLVDDLQFRDAGLDERTAAELAEHVRTQWGAGSYLAISRSMVAMNDYYGFLDAGSLERLDERLASSPDWTLAYRNPDAVIFRLR